MLEPAKLLWQSAFVDGGQRPVECFHELDQIRLVLRGQIKFFDLVAQVRIRMSTLGIPFNDFFQGFLASVVHVRPVMLNVSQRWGLEGSLVFFLLRQNLLIQYISLQHSFNY